MFALRKQSLGMMSRLTEGWRHLTTPFAFATSGVRLEELEPWRGPDRRPILDMLMVSIDISEIVFA